MASILAGASNITISGGTFAIHQGHSNGTERTAAFHRLSQAAAHSALHDAPTRTDQSRCHQHTRINVLDHLECWAQGICDEGAPVFWLHGGAGAGKSAVMQTLAERCVAQRLALGSFFFSRSDPTRNFAEVLIPTLVYQLAQSFPTLMDFLDPIISQDPLIFKRSFRTQLRDLLVRALLHLVQLGIISEAPQSPRVFIIDGLDECNDAVPQQAVVRAIAEVCHEHHVPVKFLVASRPELAISTSFECYKQKNRALGVISLSEDPGADADILRFLADEFQEIRLKHPFKKMIPSEWPDLYDINALVWKSSSHFIYASTAMKYIWSTKESPTRSLQVVLGLEVSRTIAPFTELDALYHHILRSAAHVDKVLQILAHCLASRFPPSSSSIAFFLGISKDDLFLFMADVAPLVALHKPEESSAYSEDEDIAKLLHASLGDFLGDQTRSGSLYIDRAAHLASTFKTCLRLLDLHARSHPIKPDWLGYCFGVAEHAHYVLPRDQVIQTIQRAGHLGEVQVVLNEYSLLNFYRWQITFQDYMPRSVSGLLCDLLTFFLAVQSLETREGVLFYSSYVDDFLRILRYHISQKSTPIAAAIFMLITIGHPVQAVCQALESHLDSKHPWHFEMIQSALFTLTKADFASTLDTIKTPPERLAVAAEAILVYVFDVKVLPRYLPPGRKGMEPISEKFMIVSRLLDNLLWMLPKAAISKTIILYSKKRLSSNIPLQFLSVPISRVEECLREYTTRVQSTKLEELQQRIEDGDITALMEKSCMLYLDNQD